jgi:hypothetical protein
VAIGKKLWEGKGKSTGPGTIKSITAEGVTSEYSWSAQVKGIGCAEGAHGNIHLTAIGKNPPKGVYSETDQGIFMTATGDMCVIKGYGLMKMVMGQNPKAVSLWSFMTMSEKLGWINDLIAVVTFEAQDPMWNEFTITINEWI